MAHLRLIQIIIRIILFWINKYEYNFCHNDIYICIFEHDSRIYSGNRYKDICRGTSVTIRLPGQQKLMKMPFDMYNENRHVGLINLTICSPGFNLHIYNIAYIMMLYTTIIKNYYILLQYVLHRL